MSFDFFPFWEDVSSHFSRLAFSRLLNICIDLFDIKNQLNIKFLINDQEDFLLHSVFRI